MELTPRRQSSIRERIRLLRRVATIHYNQPATALWRVPEVEVVLDQIEAAGRALDLGCGDGTLATVLFSGLSRVRWMGLDIDPTDATRARGSGVYRAVIAASAASVPYADESFDLVFSNSALEHMSDLDKVISEVARVLRPGGRFVFTVPLESLHQNLLWPRVLRLIGLRRPADRYVRHLDRRIAHVNYLSPSGWAEAVAAAGLELRTGVGYLSRAEVAWWETLANATGGLVYLLAGGRKSPREIQQSVGIDGAPRPWLGKLVFWILLPFMLLAGFGGKRFSALYAEAVKIPVVDA